MRNIQLLEKILLSNRKIEENEIDRILENIYFINIPAINISFPELIDEIIDEVYEVEYGGSRLKGLKQKLKSSYDEYINGTVDILNQLATEVKPIFEEFNPNWSVGFQNTSDIQKFKDLISNDIEFYLNDKSNRNIEGKGSGLQRLGYILLHSRIIKKIRKKQVILLIDEPDIYLHQGLQKKLLKHLKDIALNSQVFITTHSSTFIDKYKLENVFLLELEVSDEKEYKRRKEQTFHILETKLVDISEQNGLKKIQEYLGIEIDDYELLDSYNILVEGDADKIYLSETSNFFEIETPKIIPIHGASKAERLIDFYDSFYKHRQFIPKILVVFDNDKTGREEAYKINKKIKSWNNINVKVLLLPNCNGFTHDIDENWSKKNENYEIEDFIYPEIILENINNLLFKKDFKKVPFKRLEAKLNANSTKLKGILELTNQLKDDLNPNEGQNININSENFKVGIANNYKLQGNKKLSERMIELNLKYPFIQEYLKKIMNINSWDIL